MNTMMIAALLTGAGLAQAGAPTPASQCGPDCDSDCCTVKVVSNVSTGDRGKNVIEKEIVLALTGDKGAAHGKSKGFMIFIDEDGKAHMKSLDPNSMHEWMGHGDGENKHKIVMKFGMSGDGDGAHGFTLPKDGFNFKWNGKGKPFSLDGMSDEVKIFIEHLKGRSRDGVRAFMFKGEPGDHGKFFFGEGAPLHVEVEIQDDRPRLGVSLNPGEEGLVIVEVMDGFPARHAGLESGDVIVTINGEGPATMDRLREALEYSHIAFGLATDEGKKKVTIRFDGDKGGAKKVRSKARMKFHIQTDDDNHKAREGRHAIELHLERRGEDGDIMEQVKKALHEAMGELDGQLDGDVQSAIKDAMRYFKDLDINAIVEGHMGNAGKGRAHRDGDAPRIRARVERLHEDRDAVRADRLHQDRGVVGADRLHLMLKKLGNDGDIADQVKKALHEAMGEFGGRLDGDTHKAIEKAMRSLGEMDFGAIMEGHMEGRGKARAPRGGDAPRFRVKIERSDDQRGKREGRARARVLRKAPQASAPKKPTAPRNRANDARFKKLEDRLDRIERLLEQIVKQG